MAGKQAVAYFRVSTQRQGVSGLGLEAQRKAVFYYAKSQQYKVVKQFTEIETGKKNNRPILKEALDYCVKNKAKLIIAKLDRLGRNLAFISTLMESKVDFIAVDNPHASKIVLHILAAFAEHERDLISKRTKEALAIAKSRGVILGPNGKKIAALHKKRSKEFVKRMRPLIDSLNQQGLKTIRELTEELNRKKVPTYRGRNSRWHASTVHTLLKRINTKN